MCATAQNSAITLQGKSASKISEKPPGQRSHNTSPIGVPIGLLCWCTFGVLLVHAQPTRVGPARAAGRTQDAGRMPRAARQHAPWPPGRKPKSTGALPALCRRTWWPGPLYGLLPKYPYRHTTTPPPGTAPARARSARPTRAGLPRCPNARRSRSVFSCYNRGRKRQEKA